MSIATRTGDDGTTGLLFNRRLRKEDPRIEANGWLDELNARLGLVKAQLAETELEFRAFLESIQEELVNLMGAVAVAPEDFQRYQDSKIPKPSPAFLAVLDERIASLEARGFNFEKWATPGATPVAAALDFARTGTRHAERCLVGLGDQLNPEYGPRLLQTLNRLSDLLWLEARRYENESNQ